MVNNSPTIFFSFKEDTTNLGARVDTFSNKKVSPVPVEAGRYSPNSLMENIGSERAVNQSSGSDIYLGSNAVSSSSDTIFRLPELGSLDYTFNSEILNQSSFAKALDLGDFVFTSKKESELFNSSNQKVFTESVVRQNNNSILRFQPAELSSGTSWWIFALIFTISALFIWFKIHYEKFFSLFFSGTLNIREAERFFSSKTSHFKRILGFTTGIMVCSLGLVIFSYFSISSNIFVANLSSYILIVGLILGYLIYRNVLGSLISVVSAEREFHDSLSFHNFIFNFVITLFLLFFGILSYYLHYEWRLFPLFGCLFVVIILLVFRSIRTIRLFILNRFSIFYWILYFCALELVPLAFLIYGFKRLVIIA